MSERKSSNDYTGNDIASAIAGWTALLRFIQSKPGLLAELDDMIDADLDAMRQGEVPPSLYFPKDNTG